MSVLGSFLQRKFISGGICKGFDFNPIQLMLDDKISYDLKKFCQDEKSDCLKFGYRLYSPQKSFRSLLGQYCLRLNSYDKG